MFIKTKRTSVSWPFLILLLIMLFFLVSCTSTEVVVTREVEVVKEVEVEKEVTRVVEVEVEKEVEVAVEKEVTRVVEVEVEKEEPAKEPATITWLLSQTWPVEGSGFLEEFYKTHPHITVEMESFPINGVYEQIQVRVGTCQSDPDVLIVNAPFTASYGLNGWLLPLDDVFTLEEKNAWYPASFEIGSYEGQFLSAPIHTSTQNIYYNADVFEAAGIAPPAPDDRLTWEELADMAVQLTQDTDGDGAIDVYGFNWEQTTQYYQLQPLFLSKGGVSVGEDGLTVDGIVNSPEWIEGLQFYGDMFNELGAAPQTEVSAWEMFRSGQLAMLLGGPWNVGRLSGAEDLGFEWGISRHPYFEGGEIVTPTSGWHLGVSACSDQPEAAKEFIHWFTTEEGGKAWFSMVRTALSAQQPVNEWITTTEQYSEAPWNNIRIAVDEASVNPVPRPPIVGYFEYQQALESAFSDIRNGTPAEEALNSAVERINSEFGKYR